MKFTCDKAALCEAVNSVSPAVSSKSTLVALECILLSVKGGELTVVGYNTELGITKTLEVTASESGDVILNARLFSEIINKMPGGALHLSVDDKLLTVITGGSAQFTIIGMSAEEYPEIPTIDPEHSFSIENTVLRSMISETLFAISQDTTFPALTGALFEGKDGILYLVSVDGKRLALRKEAVGQLEDFKFIVPGKTLSEFMKLSSRFTSDQEDGSLPVSIGVGSRHILFSCCGFTMISRLLEGDFIDYSVSIPGKGTTTAVVSTRAFIDSISRASIMITEKVKNPIKATFDADLGVIQVACETTLGKIDDQISADINGNTLRIGFNDRYMLDALKASGEDKVLLELGSTLSPIKIMPLEGDSFTFLVMPMRLKE
jgi:DNA polymerase-3 subunit beta